MSDTPNPFDPSKFVGYNLNDIVLVKFDEKAFPLWKWIDDNSLSDNISEDIRAKLIKPLEHYTNQVNAEGYVEMQFHRLMHTFGDYCRIGHEVFDMNVLIEKRRIDGLNRWVKVGTAQPTKGVPFLYRTSNKKVMVCQNRELDDWFIRKYAVTHWRYLPDDPGDV